MHHLHRPFAARIAQLAIQCCILAVVGMPICAWAQRGANAVQNAAPAQSNPGEYFEPSPRDLVVANNVGMRFFLAPGYFIGRHGMDGIAVHTSGAYGFDTGSVILQPGINFDVYLMEATVYAVVPNLRVMLPIGRFAPFVAAGAGPGFVIDPSAQDVALLGEAGAMYYTSNMGFGLVLGYERILNTDFAVWTISPALAASF